METRPLRDARDVERVVEIVNAVYPDDPIGAVDFVAWGEQALERLDLVAERDGAIVGGSRTYLESQRPNPWVHIWVPPEERRQGIGSALFAEISRWAAGRGYSAFEAWVREDSAASQAFASGLGFEETGRGYVARSDDDRAAAVEAPDGSSSRPGPTVPARGRSTRSTSRRFRRSGEEIPT
jgi:RimJ/RimL family protein N-acetyltransferase